MDIKSVNHSTVNVNTQSQKKIETKQAVQTKVDSTSEIKATKVKESIDNVSLTYTSLSQKVAGKKQEADVINKASEQDRTVRVNELKAQVQNGQFKVNTLHIADKMMNDKATVTLLTSN
jgi:anti-sigma28 factor (negative regulator of flagellin synthesis)